MTTMKVKRLGDIRPGGINLNDLVDIEDEFGPLELVDFGRPKVNRFILWLFHRHDQPDVTVEDVGNMYNATTLQEATQQVLALSGLAAEPGEAPPAVAG